MQRYRKQFFIFNIIFVLLVTALVILYGHLVMLYKTHTLFIIFIFAILITATIYAYDVVSLMLNVKIKGSYVKIQELDKKINFPKTISIHEVRRKNHQSVYRYQGFNIPIWFIEHIEQDRGYLYPIYDLKGSKDDLYEILESYRFKFFLVKDREQKKYIVKREQILSTK